MNEFEYIETNRITPKKLVDNYTVEIDYLYANMIYLEYINALNELIEFENNCNNQMIMIYNNENTRSLLNEKEINCIEKEIITYYVLYLRTVNLACEACENYAKAILIEEKEPTLNIKRCYAHNLFNIYNRLNESHNKNFSNITKEDIEILKDLSPETIRDEINIRSRYPGEIIINENCDIVFKLLEDIRNIGFMKNSIKNNNIYIKNNNIYITEELKEKYQDKINLINSELLTEELSNLVNSYDYNYIFSKKVKTEEERINIYTIRSRIIKKSCDVFEQSSNYLNIKNGFSWYDVYETGHSFRSKFNLMDEKSRVSIMLELFFNIDSIEEHNILSNALINSEPNEINLLLKELMEEKYIDNDRFLNLTPKDTRTLQKEGNVVEDINIENIYDSIENLFRNHAVSKLNVLSRNPGENYMNYNCAFLVDIAFAIANEVLVIDNSKKYLK